MAIHMQTFKHNHKITHTYICTYILACTYTHINKQYMHIVTHTLHKQKYTYTCTYTIKYTHTCTYTIKYADNIYIYKHIQYAQQTNIYTCIYIFTNASISFLRICKVYAQHIYRYADAQMSVHTHTDTHIYNSTYIHAHLYT